MADDPTLAPPPSAGSSRGGTIRMVLMGVAGLYVGKMILDHFTASKEEASGPPAGAHDNETGHFLAIPDTKVVMLEGETHHGPVRYFDPEVQNNALRNLAAVYDYSAAVDKPLVGDSFARVQRHTAAGMAKKGERAFDWAASATQHGYFVVMPAQSGSGPWAQDEGNNVMLAVKPEDMSHDAILDEWAVIAEPGTLGPALTSLETAELDKQLTAG